MKIKKFNKRLNKIVSFFMLFLTIFTTFGIPKVNAAIDSIVSTDKLDVYVIKDDHRIKWYEHMSILRRSSDWQFVYCLEPIENVISGSSYDTGNYTLYNISHDQWIRANLLAYYGYQYGDHYDTKWYAVTQLLIWQTVAPNIDFYFTDTLNGNRIDPYQSEIAELNRLVEQHYTKPSFQNQTVKLNLGETKTLTDSNGVLNAFDVDSSNSSILATIDGNNLKLTANKAGETTLTFTKRSKDRSTPPIIYTSSQSQDVFAFGYYDPLTFNLNIKIQAGRIQLIKHDSENNSCVPTGEAVLSGAKYGVYERNNLDNLLDTIMIGDDCTGYSKDLPLGEYSVKEISASQGYELDKTVYDVTISTEENYVTVPLTVKEQVIRRDVSIFKVYGTDNTQVLLGEENAIFEIYDYNDQLVETITTDENGKVTINLPYGTYTFKQIKGAKGHELVAPFTVTVDENSPETVDKVVSNAKIRARLKVIKVDSETNNTLGISGIKFRIKNLDTNEYVKMSVSYPYPRIIDIFETTEDGTLLLPEMLFAGNYQLEEVDQKIDGYVWNDQPLKFTIDENSHLITDEVFGPILEVRFENSAVKGQLTIHKTGEQLIIDDGQYHYEEIELPNVEFDIVADEEIKQGGKIYYIKDEVVDHIKTNDDGIAILDNLPLGKYYVVETKTVENHVLDPIKYQFELKYKDQYTDVVYSTINLKNYYAKGGLDFTKQDLVTGDPLPNTTISIYTEDDQLVFTGTTDENGKIVIDDLPVGKYYMLETNAPEGYILNPDKMFFQIKEGEILKAEMTNEKIVEVPNTSLSNVNYEVMGSLVLIVSGLGLIGYGVLKKKRK